MRDTAHPSHPLTQGEVRAHSLLQDRVQTMDIKLKNLEEGNKVYDEFLSLIIQVPVSTLPKVCWRNTKTVVPQNTHVKIVPWKGNRHTDSVSQEELKILLHNSLWESLKGILCYYSHGNQSRYCAICLLPYHMCSILINHHGAPQH